MSNATNAPDSAATRGRRKANPAPVAPTIWEQWQFVVVGAGVLILCTVFITGVFYVLRQVQLARVESDADRSQQQPIANNPATQQSNLALTGAVLGKSTDSPVTEESVAVRARLLGLQEKIREAREGLDSIQQLKRSTYDTILELYGNESGRRIAAKKENVKAFMAVRELAVPSSPLVDSLRERVDLFSESIAASLKGDIKTIATPSGELDGEIDALLHKIKELEYQLASQQDSFNRLQRLAADDPPAEQTLSKALTAVENEVTTERLAALRATQDEARQQADALILAAEKEAIAARGRAEAEARRVLGEAEAAALIEAVKLQSETNAAAIREKRDSQRNTELRARAADPIVQQKYTPFLDKGKVKFDSGDLSYSGLSERMLPVSWQNLNQAKWLDSVERFAKAMNSPYGETKNDRRIKPYPRTESEWREMEQLYQDFKQLGPIWVEMGLLLP